MAEAVEEANQGLTRTLKDLFGGAVGGVAQVLIGMPVLVLIFCNIVHVVGPSVGMPLLATTRAHGNWINLQYGLLTIIHRSTLW